MQRRPPLSLKRRRGGRRSSASAIRSAIRMRVGGLLGRRQRIVRREAGAGDQRRRLAGQNAGRRDRAVFVVRRVGPRPPAGRVVAVALDVAGVAHRLGADPRVLDARRLLDGEAVFGTAPLRMAAAIRTSARRRSSRRPPSGSPRKSPPPLGRRPPRAPARRPTPPNHISATSFPSLVVASRPRPAWSAPGRAVAGHAGQRPRALIVLKYRV